MLFFFFVFPLFYLYSLHFMLSSFPQWFVFFSIIERYYIMVNSNAFYSSMFSLSIGTVQLYFGHFINMVVVGVYFDFSLLCMQYNVTQSGIYLLYHLYHKLNNEFPYLYVRFYHSAVMYLFLLCSIW